MSTAPFFSIIIPTKDRAHLLKECLDSVIKQRFNNYEVIIIDDSKSKESQMLYQGISDDRFHYQDVQFDDRSLSRNTGISLARGKYICFVDDDDMLKENYLHEFYAYLEQNDFPKTILRTGFIKYTSEEVQSKSSIYNPSLHKNPVAFAAFNMCGVWSLCIPKSFLEEDVFPKGFPHWQDTHLILRLLAKHDFYQLPSHQYVYRIHSERGSTTVESENQLAKRAQINVAAIKDFFANYNILVKDFLPAKTLSFLCAEKYIQYALLAKKSKFHSLAKKLFSMSASEKVDLRLWKHYLLYNLYRMKK